MKKLQNIISLIVGVLLFSGVVYAASETIKIDVNDRPVSAGVTDDSNEEVRNLRVDPATGALLVTGSSLPSASTDYFDGRKTVTTAGTAVKVTASTTTFASCDFQAEESNTGDVMIGASTVDETPATARGVRLVAGGSYSLSSPGDLQYIYLDSEVNGEGVTYFCQK